MNLPMISVILPCYRAEATLERAVESVLREAPENLEVLLVEDGSPDNTGALCDALARQDARIRFCTAPTAAPRRPATPGWTPPGATGSCLWTPTTNCCPACGRRLRNRWLPGPP